MNPNRDLIKTLTGPLAGVVCTIVYLLCYAEVLPLGELIVAGDPKTAMLEPWRLLTHPFIHLSATHLAVNVTALIIAFSWLGRKTGALKSIAVCLGGAVCGAACFLAVCGLSGHSDSFVGGASGGIYSMLTCAALLNNGLTIRVWDRNVRLNGKIMVTVLAAVAVSGIFGVNPGGAIAHAGGIIAGASFALLAPKEHKPQRNPLADKAQQSGYLSLTPGEKSRLGNHLNNPEL